MEKFKVIMLNVENEEWEDEKTITAWYPGAAAEKYVRDLDETDREFYISIDEEEIMVKVTNSKDQVFEFLVKSFMKPVYTHLLINYPEGWDGNWCDDEEEIEEDKTPDIKFNGTIQ